MYFISLIKDIKNKIAKVLRKQTDERTDSGNGNTGMKYKLSGESVVWIFSGEGARFASAVFISQKLVENWIKKFSLSGVLTAYPVNIDVYEWAVKKVFLQQKKMNRIKPRLFKNLAPQVKNIIIMRMGI